MPEVCRFLGIKILFYYDEHNPPHFHVQYNEYRGVLLIETLEEMKGNLPKKVLNLVREWAFDCKDDLIKEWSLAQENLPLFSIAPLV
ncbi:MAG: DUF4160 domain-containing protein [Candidatus Peregrinibacteria bacterium]